ncbi:MAG: HPr family phosphocarrier protein [Planctomycetes bacterium]|nr:HPr family phosphocarrier protein [Planctomycetota bacterium]
MDGTEIVRTIAISNRHGLHARASTRLAQVAKQFRCAIRLGRHGAGDEVDAKSILGILTLGAAKGQMLSIRASGEDAEQAVAALIEIFEKNFGED